MINAEGEQEQFIWASVMIKFKCIVSFKEIASWMEVVQNGRGSSLSKLFVKLKLEFCKFCQSFLFYLAAKKCLISTQILTFACPLKIGQ